tara:strand:- start:8547 stop:10811 length:2265 start_codon:yes stop_codon:yes gene_type:complete
MSKHESFPDTSEATLVDLQFDDPKLNEYFAGSKEDAPETEPTNKEIAPTDGSSSEQTPALKQYQTERTAWKAARDNYTEAKNEYETRLTEYYKNYSDKGVFGRSTQKLSEWWKGQPEDLTELEADFKTARGEYASSLEAVMHSRSQTDGNNQEFNVTEHSTKNAFAQKFVLNPRRDQVALEKEHLVNTETAERAQQVLQTLSKHKWTIRIGMVTATGVAVGSGAGIIAGLGAASYRAARIVGGMAGGVAGAKFGDKLGRERVAAAKENLAQTQEDTILEYTTENIDQLESALVNAEQTVDAKEQQRKFAIIAGAIAGGGSLANLDRIAGAAGDALVSPAAASTADLEALSEAPTRGDLLRSTETDPGMSEDHWAKAVIEEPTADPEAEKIAAETMDALKSTDPEAREIAAETMRVLEETRPEIMIGDHMIESGDTLWHITKDSYSDHLEGLTNAQKNQVLDAVFDDLRKDPDLTKSLGIRSGNIDLIYPQDTLKMSLLDELVEEKITALNETGSVSDVSETATEASKVTASANPDGHTPHIPEPANATSGAITSVSSELQDGDLTPEITTTQSEPGVETVKTVGHDVKITNTTNAPSETILNVNTEELRAYQAAMAEHTRFYETRGAEVFGSEDAFKAAKLEAIEEIVGEQPKSWGGGDRFNPVYERIKLASLKVLAESGIADVQYLDRGAANQFLAALGLDQSNSNFQDLQRWHEFYKDAIKPSSLRTDGIVIKPNMTFDHLFMQYVIANNNR